VGDPLDPILGSAGSSVSDASPARLLPPQPSSTLTTFPAPSRVGGGKKMSMDLIAATVTLTSVFLIVAGTAGLLLTRSMDGRHSVLDVLQRGKVILAVLILVYFLGITDVFIITQQFNLAFTNLTAGLALAAIQYFSGAPRQTASSTERSLPTDPAEPPEPGR
jgi:hypothetical protein